MFVLGLRYSISSSLSLLRFTVNQLWLDRYYPKNVDPITWNLKTFFSQSNKMHLVWDSPFISTIFIESISKVNEWISPLSH